MSPKHGKRPYITDANHMPSLLTPNTNLPPMFVRFTEYLGDIITIASRSSSAGWKASKVKCRRRPGRRPCSGPINVRTGCENPPEIQWECASCGEHGVIRNWQGCEWDNSEDRWNLFDAEGAYAESIFRDAMGDSKGSVAALEKSLSFKPDYAPAVLSMGSVKYQRRRKKEGRRLLFSLVEFPDDTSDLTEIIDKAGTFLIHNREYEDGLALYNAAAERFPDTAIFHAGRSCCAGHLDRHGEALDASRRALELEPDNQAYVNDLGWSLVLAGYLDEAVETLERAVAMDSSDKLARENLRRCEDIIAERKKSATNRKTRRTDDSSSEA
jgi:Flp pilus assembly protein TadD